MNDKNYSTCVKNIINIVLFILAISILGVSLYQHFYQIQEFNQYLGFIGLFLLFISRIDVNTITSFSMGLIKLERKINEADNLLERLRNIITPISEVAMTVAVKAGRMVKNDKISKNRLHYLRCQIEDELKKIYLDSCLEGTNKINQVFNEYHKFILFDLALPIFEKILDKLDKIRQNILNEINNYSQPVTKDDNYKSLASNLHYINDIERQLKDRKKLLEYVDFDTYIISFIKELNSDVFSIQSKNELLTLIKGDMDQFQYYYKNKQFMNDGN